MSILLGGGSEGGGGGGGVGCRKKEIKERNVLFHNVLFYG